MKKIIIAVILTFGLGVPLVVWACGGTRCITLPDGTTHCMYCNCEGQCF